MKKENNSKGEALPANEISNEAKEVSILTKPEEIKKTLEEQIKKYDRLNRLVSDRSIFLAKRELLTSFLQQVKLEVKGDNLETKVCKMVLSDPNTYKNEGITISNSLVIEKAIRFISEEINEKVKLIESEILTIN